MAHTVASTQHVAHTIYREHACVFDHAHSAAHAVYRVLHLLSGGIVIAPPSIANIKRAMVPGDH